MMDASKTVLQTHAENIRGFVLQTLIPLFFFSLFFSSTLCAQQILVKPYLQPGNASNFSKEEKVLIWQTDSVPGNFKVEYRPGSFEEPGKNIEAKISSVKLLINHSETILYRATLKKIKVEQSYSYRVSLEDKTITQYSFNSRKKNSSTKLAVFGDCGRGTPEQAKISYQVYKQQPDFVLVTGDNVYSRGLESEYRNNFFPYYNSETESPEKGSSIMRTIPFYMILGNHDVYGADLAKYPGGLAYFYYNDLPLNAPQPEYVVKPEGDPKQVKSFIEATKPRFPNMSNYSFDYGNVHIVCLDANPYVNPLDPALVSWMRTDLQQSNAAWKMVAYHHPGFNSSKAHYDEQHMRILSPLMEELKVDLVLTGHVHNYQRSFPLKFDPAKDASGQRYVISKEGRVDGKFTLDQDFNGVSNTKPKGVIYIVTGAGGASLYDPKMTGNPETWKHDPPENWVPFTVKMIADKHSFTLIETTSEKLNLKQLDVEGMVLDEINITR